MQTATGEEQEKGEAGAVGSSELSEMLETCDCSDRYPTGSEEILAQGAEAKVYKAVFLGKPALVKERFTKRYRHPDLDAHLSKERLKTEVRALARCRQNGIRVPTLYFIDPDRNLIVMEYIAGSRTVRSFVAEVQREFPDEETGFRPRLTGLARAMGRTIASLHRANIVHGDLTTSNMLMSEDVLTSTSAGGDTASDEDDGYGIVLIDFGLASQNGSAEDKGVDLYVLEKAFISTHPNTLKVFDEILAGYRAGYKGVKNGSGGVLRKLDEVRLRGRKREMVG